MATAHSQQRINKQRRYPTGSDGNIIGDIEPGFYDYYQQAIPRPSTTTTNNNNNNVATDDGTITGTSTTISTSQYCIDYKKFKKRLKYFARRRIQVSNIIRNSTDQRISDTVFTNIIGQPIATIRKDAHSGVATLQRTDDDDQLHEKPIIGSLEQKLLLPTPSLSSTVLLDENDEEQVVHAINKNIVDDNYNDDDDDRKPAASPMKEIILPTSYATENEDKNDNNNNRNRENDKTAAFRRNTRMQDDDDMDDDDIDGYYVQFVEPSASTDHSDMEEGRKHNTTNANYNNNTNTATKKKGSLFRRRNRTGGANNVRRRSYRSAMRQLSALERNEIITFLGIEMDKVLMYYLNQCNTLRGQINEVIESDSMNAKVAYTLGQHNITRPSDRSSSNQDAPTNMNRYQHHIQLGNEILELIFFCIFNIVTAQQILVRYDTFAREFDGTPMFTYYMKNVLAKKNDSNNNLSTLDDDDEEDVAGRGNYRNFDDTTMQYQVQQRRIRRKTKNRSGISPFRKVLCHDELNRISDKFATAIISNQEHLLVTFQSSQSVLIDILYSLRSTDGMMAMTISNSMPSRSNTTDIDTNTFAYCCNTVVYDSIRKWVTAVSKLDSRLGLEPAYLVSRDCTLIKQMEQLVRWRHYDLYNDLSLINNVNDMIPTATDYNGIPNTININNDTTGGTKTNLSLKQKYHIALNLLSAFLYCMNYYIVEPSSAMYVSRLGAYDAMAGTLIGMVPLAAFLTAIPYSVLTNYSFRYPLIASSILLIIGNLVYSIADVYGEIYIALIGRFICGCGAPKCIIRRYMADTTPMAVRTSVNAGFGMVVAAGSAMGPAMAVVLNRLKIQPISFGGYYIELNGLTLPGYFMASLWMIYFIVVVLTFYEPDREGLKEQQEIERNKSHVSIAMVPTSPTLQATTSVGAYTKSNNDCDNRSTCETAATDDVSVTSSNSNSTASSYFVMPVIEFESSPYKDYGTIGRMYYNLRSFLNLISLPVIICLSLLFAKVFTIESLVSATSVITKNRYQWQVEQVGTLGFINGIAVIPFSILIGRLSMSYQDHILMKGLLMIGCFGLLNLIDISDLLHIPTTSTYNEGNRFAVGTTRYMCGYFISYLSIQSLEGVIGSTLSKIIPTALASGTFNSGLLATLVDTFGRACGDLFISAMGFISLRQLLNLLFLPSLCIMLVCLIIIERFRDILSV